MKKYKIQNRSPKVSHACVPLIAGDYLSFHSRRLVKHDKDDII
jgi:hypothetical protein